MAFNPSTEKEAMADALYRCMLGLDTKDRNLFNSAWSTNHGVVSWEINDRPPVIGLEAINARLFDHVTARETQHFITNIQVSSSGPAVEGLHGGVEAINQKTANVKAYCISQHFRPGEGLDPTTRQLLTGSMYSIDLIQEGDGSVWRMRRWVMKQVWLDGDITIMRPLQ